MNPKTFDVIIVGAGLAGLSCAHRFQAQGADYLLIEASDRVGGRVKTDVVTGFFLNHGFQVMQTAYPEAQRFLDYAALGLKAFEPGVVFRIGGRFHTVADPLRAPRYMIQTLAAPIGTWGSLSAMVVISHPGCPGPAGGFRRRCAAPSRCRAATGPAGAGTRL